jgi:uncharacterized protein (TIGR03437 family)
LFGVARGAVDGLDHLRPRAAYFGLAEQWGGTPSPGLAIEEPPRIDAGGLTNMASGFDGIAPGSLFRIRGQAFTAGSVEAASGGDLPYQLGDASVCVEQRPAPLYLSAADEIRAQLPWETPLGSRPVIVYRGGVASQPAQVEVMEAAPGIFENAVFRPGLPCPVDATNGARAGDYLEIYGTGLGAVSGAAATGRLATEPMVVDAQPHALLNGREIEVVFSGLLAGAAGVYQTNARIPAEIAPGLAQLQLRQNGRLSNAAAVQIAGAADTPRLLLGAWEPSALTLQAGGPPAVSTTRVSGRNGFCELVRFSLAGLPSGVRASIPVGIPGQAVSLKLWAEAGAPRAENAVVAVAAVSGLGETPRQPLRLTVLAALGDIRFRVVSGGWLSGAPRASFEVDGSVVYQTSGGGPGRGFSFLVVDAQTGVLSPVRAFDTWGNEGDVVAMEAFLQSLTPGQVVLAAIADDGSLLLTDETRRVFRETLGAQLVDSLTYQASWAIVSRVGASQPIAEALMLDEAVVLDRTLTFPMP